jgi:dihydrolipoamide dehydrogenase
MSELYVIKMPQLSDTMTEGVLVSWEKNIGDAIKRGDIVATVETDKAVMDVEVFRDGFLSGPIAAIDAVVPVTHAIGYLVDSKDEVVDTEAEQAAPPPGPAASGTVTTAAAASPAPAAATAPLAPGAASWLQSRAQILTALAGPVPPVLSRQRIYSAPRLRLKCPSRVTVVR